ncbi:MAG: DUF4416 family protein [Desulfobacterota bacterium]|nr:DUF4416 family protein [Thermodesulfobacteriota bacterium]
MGEPRTPLPVTLFMSVIFNAESILGKALEDLQQEYGAIDWMSERLPFDFTDYYAREMGTGLFRHFVTFASLIPRESLPEIKLNTNRIEARWSTVEGRRQVNIDPGYLCLEHIVLATTKGYAHRPYLSKGIYADLTLIYRKGSFQPLEWTYPDYRQEQTLQMFNQIRKRYLLKLRETQGRRC